MTDRTAGVLAIGGSAGAVEALVELVAGLPADLPVPVLVTLHVGQHARSNLPRILSRSGPLPAAHAGHGEPLVAGRIYVAPPDRHLFAVGGVVHLSRGPRVNRHRPAVDVMFAGVAGWAGRGTVAVVLSGLLDDGATGAVHVARAGGAVVVQDPADALFDSMPRAALSAVPEATVVPLPRIGATIGEAVRRRTGAAGDAGGSAVADPGRMADGDDLGYLAPDETRLTRLSCPDCHGSLAEIRLGGIDYYRCHVGHQFGPQSLEAAQREAVEATLWAAAAALEEHAVLARHLAGRSVAADGGAYRRAAQRSAQTARALLDGLAHPHPEPPDTPDTPDSAAAG